LNDKQAQFILDHPLVKDFFIRFHEQIYGAIKRSNTVEDRDRLASYGRCADEFEGYFRRFIETGKMDALLKEQEEKQKSAMERAKDRFFPNW
jgi:hypothetical protein